MIWSIAARPSSYKKHAQKSLIERIRRKIEYAKAQVRAKFEPRFALSSSRLIIRKCVFVAWRKHRAADNIVRFTEPADDSKTTDEYGRGASVMRANRPETARSEERTLIKGQKGLFSDRLIFEFQVVKA